MQNVKWRTNLENQIYDELSELAIKTPIILEARSSLYKLSYINLGMVQKKYKIISLYKINLVKKYTSRRDGGDAGQ